MSLLHIRKFTVINILAPAPLVWISMHFESLTLVSSCNSFHKHNAEWSTVYWSTHSFTFLVLLLKTEKFSSLGVTARKEGQLLTCLISPQNLLAPELIKSVKMVKIQHKQPKNKFPEISSNNHSNNSMYFTALVPQLGFVWKRLKLIHTVQLWAFFPLS